MRTAHATLVQAILALILFITAVFIPAIRQFMFNHIPFVVIALCITGIIYMQMLKMIYAKEKRLKSKIKYQSQLIENLLLANSINVRLLKDVALPELFEYNTDAFLSRLHASGLDITQLMNYGIDKNIIAHYELFYYIGKAKEQQELLNSHKKTAIEDSTSLLKDISSEPGSGKYTLRPVTAM